MMAMIFFYKFFPPFYYCYYFFLERIIIIVIIEKLGLLFDFWICYDFRFFFKGFCFYF